VPFDWEQKFASRVDRMTGSAIRDLLRLAERPDVISFAGGLPAVDVLPAEEVERASQRILRNLGSWALQYGATEGYLPLREWIAGTMSQEGIPITVDNVLITTGSQQALDLLGKIFVGPGDWIAVESPTYPAALQAWSAYEGEFLPIPSDERGMILDQLEEQLAAGPKFLYCLPNFQNPRGVTLVAERRENLVAVATRAGVPIVEDDPYRDLRFEGDHLPRLLAIDAQRRGVGENSYRGGVIYVSSFSKILSPGIRVGWLIAAPEVIRRLVLAKQSTDLHTSTFNQMLAYDLARTGYLVRHIPTIVHAYRERRDVMLAALREHFPPNVRWTHPQGGMFIWVTLPEDYDAQVLLGEAIARKVAFVPGASFHVDGRGANTLRLNFTNATPERIREGIARLGCVLREQLRPRRTSRVA